MANYPEHEKMRKISDQSQAVGDFLEWVRSEKGWFLAQRDDETKRIWPASYSTVQLLAEFFEIDLDKIEDEKRAMLASLGDVRVQGDELCDECGRSDDCECDPGINPDFVN